MLSPGALCPPQVYRKTVIAQWRALDLDVLLTPMLGPALDLNAPGKATGEARHPPCPFYESGHVPCRAARKWKKRSPRGGPCPCGGPQSGWLETWESRGMPWQGLIFLSSALFKLGTLNYRI